MTYMAKKVFKPQVEIFDAFKKPFADENNKVISVNAEKTMACCACTACTACR